MSTTKIIQSTQKEVIQLITIRVLHAFKHKYFVFYSLCKDFKLYFPIYGNKDMYTCVCTCKVQFTLVWIFLFKIIKSLQFNFQNFDEQLATVSSLTSETCTLQNQTNDEVTIVII